MLTGRRLVRGPAGPPGQRPVRVAARHPGGGAAARRRAAPAPAALARVVSRTLGEQGRPLRFGAGVRGRPARLAGGALPGGGCRRAPGPAGWAAAAGPPGPFRFAGASGAPGAAAETLDDLLRLSVSHRDEARRARRTGGPSAGCGASARYISPTSRGSLAAREGEDPDALLREFLDRPALTCREARRRRRWPPTPGGGVTRRRRGGAPGRVPAAPGRPADSVLSPCRRGVGGEVWTGPWPWPRQDDHRPGRAAGRRAAASRRRRGFRVRASAGRWWFWPLLALCLALPAAALSGGGQDRLLPAWVASGFLSAMLLLVGLGVRAGGAGCLPGPAGGGTRGRGRDDVGAGYRAGKSRRRGRDGWPGGPPAHDLAHRIRHRGAFLAALGWCWPWAA